MRIRRIENVYKERKCVLEGVKMRAKESEIKKRGNSQ